MRLSPSQYCIIIEAIKPYQGEKAVQIVDDRTDSLIYQPVKVGASDDSQVEILSGLSEGDEVVVSLSSSNDKDKKMMFPGK